MSDEQLARLTVSEIVELIRQHTEEINRLSELLELRAAETAQ